MEDLLEFFSTMLSLAFPVLAWVLALGPGLTSASSKIPSTSTHVTQDSCPLLPRSEGSQEECHGLLSKDVPGPTDEVLSTSKGVPQRQGSRGC